MSYLYFAYGSNMLTRRLRERAPSARVAATGFVEGYRLTFNKLSMDGSGKCNIEKSADPAKRVYGVVFRIDTSESEDLDRAEGLGRGYQKDEIRVATPVGDVRSLVYIGNATQSSLRPYDWYKRLVLRGAVEHGLPPEYVSEIEAVESRPDSDETRTRKAAAILEREVVSDV